MLSVASYFRTRALPLVFAFFFALSLSATSISFDPTIFQRSSSVTPRWDANAWARWSVSPRDCFGSWEKTRETYEIEQSAADAND